MGWSVGYDEHWKRDIGYGVPSRCDFPGCEKQIDRGLSRVCGGEPYGGTSGCGLFFCEDHMHITDEGLLCERCRDNKEPFNPTADTPEWIEWKLTHDSWKEWRDQHPNEVQMMRANAKHERTPE